MPSPDLFKNDAVPADAMGSGSTFNMTAWRQVHTVAMADAIVEITIKYMRSELGAKKIGAVGYCYGGKFVARFLAAGKGLDAGFTAHPSNVENGEWNAVVGPLSIAYGGELRSPMCERTKADNGRIGRIEQCECEKYYRGYVHQGRQNVSDKSLCWC